VDKNAAKPRQNNQSPRKMTYSHRGVKIRVPAKPTVPRSRCLSGLCGDDLRSSRVKNPWTKKWL